jgi:hypothetical protein
MVWGWAGTGVAVLEERPHPHSGPGENQMDGHLVHQDILDKVDVGFLMEVEGFAAKVGAENESDITLATVELTVDADVVDGVAAHLGLLWEEDVREDHILDEGYIVFGATENIPVYATMGKMYLPFGDFKSAFISDPLTLEMAEINESAALVGYGTGWVDLKIGTFSGELENDADDNTINSTFASVRFSPVDGVVFGAYWLSDLLYTDGFEDFANDAILAGYGYESIGGAGAFLNAQIGPVALRAEYVAALEAFDPLAGGLQPSAYNIEASMPLAGKWSAGVKFEGSDDFYSDFGTAPDGKWADWQAGFVVSYVLSHHVTFSGEYLHAEGLDGNESADTATVQVALVL